MARNDLGPILFSYLDDLAQFYMQSESTYTFVENSQQQVHVAVLLHKQQHMIAPKDLLQCQPFCILSNF